MFEDVRYNATTNVDETVLVRPLAGAAGAEHSRTFSQRAVTPRASD